MISVPGRRRGSGAFPLNFVRRAMIKIRKIFGLEDISPGTKGKGNSDFGNDSETDIYVLICLKNLTTLKIPAKFLIARVQSPVLGGAFHSVRPSSPSLSPLSPFLLLLLFFFLSLSLRLFSSFFTYAPPSVPLLLQRKKKEKRYI